jgi:hypothetical protein
MSSLVKFLTVVMVLVGSSQFAHASSYEQSENNFKVLQKELWNHGVPRAELESGQELDKEISDISELSASDFYPEELTQALNRI